MIEQKAQDVYFDIEDAILNEEFPGFKEDYLVLHSLIREYKPRTFCEIGTNCGTGTNIICNAMKDKSIQDYVQQINDLKNRVYSLDLPTELAHISLQHPISEGKGDKVGINCQFPYTQLRGDSMKFDFSEYPCEGYFIDGEHDYEHPLRETLAALSQEPKIIIWHDADIPEVWQAVTEVMNSQPLKGNDKMTFVPMAIHYAFYRIIDTRVAYAVRRYDHNY